MGTASEQSEAEAVTEKQKRQAAAVAGLALLVWWLWPPEEVVTASIDTTPDLTDEELSLEDVQL